MATSPGPADEEEGAGSPLVEGATEAEGDGAAVSAIAACGRNF